MQTINNKIFINHESNVRSYCNVFPAVFNKAKDSCIYDEYQNKFIDFFMGAGALNYGHNNQIIQKELINYIQNDNISHSLDFHTIAKRDFIEKFYEIILKPRNLNYKFLFSGPTGTNSIEVALKIARKFTNRTNIACFTNAFHGMSLGSLSITGNKTKRNASGCLPLLSGVDRYCFDNYLGDKICTIEIIDKLLSDNSSGFQAPAAFIVEIIQAEGGINVSSIQWIQKLSALAKKYNSLLIVDDIQVGCGRTGKFFSFEDYGIYPDIVCLSKSLSGYGLPLSLVLVNPQFDILKSGEHNGTFRGNNLAFITASKALDFWQDNNFLAQINNNIVLLDNFLHNIEQNFNLNIKGKGLIRGIELKDEAMACNISKRAFEKHLIIETCGKNDEVIKLLPALNINQEDLLNGLNILFNCINDEINISSTSQVNFEAQLV